MAESSSKVKAGRAYVEILADDNALARGLNRASGRLKAWGAGISSFGRKIAAIGALITGPLILAAKAAADSGAKLYDMSKRTGISVENLSRLGFAADLTGTDIEGLERGLIRMSKSVAGVADETEGTTGSLNHLGISAESIAKKNPAEQFAIIAQQIRRIKDPSEKSAAAMKVFGRTGTFLIPMIDDLDELNAQAERFGFVKSTESAKQAKEFSVALKLAAKAASQVANTLGAAVIPALKAKTELVMRLNLQIRDWAKQNKPLIALIFNVALAATIAGAAIIILGKAFTVAAIAANLLSVSVAVTAAVIDGLATPIGLVAVGLAALAAYFLFTTETGGKALAWLGDQFNILKTDALAAFGGIKAAMMAGDWKLAAEIAWTLIKLEWERGLNAVKHLWVQAKAFLIGTGYEIAYGILEGMQVVWAGLKQGWAESLAFVKTLWSNFKGAGQAFIEEQIARTTDGVIVIQGLLNHTSQKEIAAARRGAAQESRDRLAAIGAENIATNAGIEADRQKAIDDAQRDLNRQLRKLDEQKQAALAGIEGDDAAAQAAGEQKVAELRAKLEALRRQAEAEKATGAGGGPGELPNLPALPDPNNIANLKNKLSAVGTFNAAAAQQLFGKNDFGERIARNTERTAKGVEKLAEDRRNADGTLLIFGQT